MRTSSACGRPAPCWRAAHFAFVKKRREEEQRHAPKAKALTEEAPLEKQNDVMFDLFSGPTNLVILGFFRSAPDAPTVPRETERDRERTQKYRLPYLQTHAKERKMWAMRWHLPNFLRWSCPYTGNTLTVRIYSTALVQGAGTPLATPQIRGGPLRSLHARPENSVARGPRPVVDQDRWGLTYWL